MTKNCFIQGGSKPCQSETRPAHRKSATDSCHSSISRGVQQSATNRSRFLRRHLFSHRAPQERSAARQQRASPARVRRRWLFPLAHADKSRAQAAGQLDGAGSTALADVCHVRKHFKGLSSIKRACFVELRKAHSFINFGNCFRFVMFIIFSRGSN